MSKKWVAVTDQSRVRIFTVENQRGPLLLDPGRKGVYFSYTQALPRSCINCCCAEKGSSSPLLIR